MLQFHHTLEVTRRKAPYPTGVFFFELKEDRQIMVRKDISDFEYEYHVQPVRNIIDYSFITEISPITGKERSIGPIPNFLLVETIQDLKTYRKSQKDILRDL